MELFDRIYAVHGILSGARHPVPIARFLRELECTRSTFKRVKGRMVDYLNAPIRYDRDRNGYYYDASETYELPGLWFTPTEIYALLAAEQLLEQAEPGIFAKRLEPLRTRIGQIIEQAGGLDAAQLRLRVRLAPSAQRRGNEKKGEERRRTLGAITDALLNRHKLHFNYLGRTRNRTSVRLVSPQRLVRYRDNWFLDAWCHGKEALRTFAAERMSSSKVVQETCLDIEEAKLAELDQGYGIFSGPARHQAVLRFTGHAARWVADETWHVDQKGQWVTDGSYELVVPYADHRELLMDIQRFGPEVEVVGPKALRDSVAENLKKAADIYRQGGA